MAISKTQLAVVLSNLVELPLLRGGDWDWEVSRGASGLSQSVILWFCDISNMDT